MASAIASFFQRHLAERANEVDAHVKARRARLAAAALLVEVVHADGTILAEERAAILAGIRARFGLAEGEAIELLALAESQARQAVDVHQFTSLINQQFDMTQKLELIEELWRAAFADAVLHRHEEQLVRKVSDLLYVSHTAMLAAKHRVQSGVQQQR